MLLSLPGMGPVLAAQFLAATGGDVTVFQAADRFAAVSGLAPASREDRERAEGKRHTQAVLALARRRSNVLWAILRDNRCFTPAPAAAAA